MAHVHSAGTVLAISATLSLGLSVQAAHQAGLFRTGTDRVLLDAVVTDRGQPVLSLGPESFEVRDNGVLQEILYFSAQDFPVEVTAVVDNSASMDEGRRAAVERAALRLGAALGGGDVGSLLPFSSKVESRVGLQPSSFPLERQTSMRGTAALDALNFILRQPPSGVRRQFNLFMSDGEDNVSTTEAGKVLDAAKSSTAQTSFMLLERSLPGDSSFESIRKRRDLAVQTMRSVARLTGGEVYALKSDDQLGEAFSTALRHARAGYVLGYMPRNVDRSGWHALTVTIKGESYNVRTRSGYLVP
jgi:hypothetical protein